MTKPIEYQRQSLIGSVNLQSVNEAERGVHSPPQTDTFVAVPEPLRVEREKCFDDFSYTCLISWDTNWHCPVGRSQNHPIIQRGDRKTGNNNIFILIPDSSKCTFSASAINVTQGGPSKFYDGPRMTLRFSW